MAKIAQGRIMLEWCDGQRREIATVDLDVGAECGKVVARTRVKRFVFGWEFVKMGLRIMRCGWRGEDTEIAEGTD